MATISGNKGEWSEIYVLFKLLGDGILYAGDANTIKIDSLFYPILSILRNDSNLYEYKPNIDRHVVIYENNNEIMRISMRRFLDISSNLFNHIKRARARSFSIENIETFMHEVKCSRLKAPADNKSDIKIIIHDLRTGMTPTLGFSIKSQIGSASTLLNPGIPTNFLYKLSGDLSDNDIDAINSIKEQSKRMDAIKTYGCSLDFCTVEHNIFRYNLMFIDSQLPEIIGRCLKIHYTEHINSVKEITEQISEDDKSNGDIPEALSYNSHKIKSLLIDIALGMTPARLWNGRYDANGGYIIVKDDGDLVCYHFYNRNDIEDYLYYNTNFDNPSRKRYDYGYLFRKDGQVYIRLNLQIRFKK